MRRDTERPIMIGIPRWWQPVIATAALALAVDTTRYLRRDDWLAPDAEPIAGLLLGATLYALILGVPALTAWVIAARGTHSAGRIAVAAAMGAAAGAAILVLIGSAAGGMRGPLYAALAALLVCYPLAWGTCTVRLARPGLIAAAMTGAPLVGTVALISFHHLFLFESNRFSASLAAAGLLSGVTVVAVLVAGQANQVAKSVAVACVLLMAAAAPLLVDGVPARGQNDIAVDETITRPNLLLIVSDTLRADYTSVHGGPVPTPWMENLAARGLMFEQAYSLAPWTLPSMIGMFASQHPPGPNPEATEEETLRGVFLHTVPRTQQTLAERMHREGYATAAFVGNALLDRQTGVLRGFDTIKARAQAWPYTQTRGGLLARTPLMHDAFARWLPSVAPTRRIDTTGILTGYGRAWLARQTGEAPFFLYVHYMDPHAPYTPPPAYQVGTHAWPYTTDTPPLDQQGRPLSPEQRSYVADYAGEIRYVDAAASLLMSALDDRVAETIVVFTSDHGEEFWDHGGALHGHTLFQELIHVPWIIHGPGIPPRRVTEPISHIDLMPTLAGLLGIPGDPDWRGNDLSNWVMDASRTPAQAPVFANSTMHRAPTGPLQAVVDGRLKRIRSLAGRGLWMFDLIEDPRERHNLEPDIGSRAKTLDSLLNDWQDSFAATFDQLQPDATDEALFQERLEQMEALGYL